MAQAAGPGGLTMQVMPATEDDKAEWLPLWRAYLDFYKQALDDEITDLTFARALESGENLNLLVAKSDGRIIGFATYVLHRSSWARDWYCYLEDLFVAEDQRGRGVARALIAAVAEAGKAKGAERLYWVTDEANKTAQALYEKLATKTDFIQFRRDL
ncbi:N-acetyltransferase family protein [Asticcacaulis taihuensis]|uniref:GNAT family N-acetyltransferase n=1 Tax=Asticcacaulis taihuensis TaxID=260084 RepID=UPI003F7C1497